MEKEREPGTRWTPEHVAENTILLDLGFQGVPGAIGSYLLTGGDELVLIESGPSTTRVSLERGFREAGYDLANVSRVILTHIHLDHAGGMGTLMRDYPHMRTSVHPDAAPFLVNPERLVKSSARIFGDQMEQLWGEIIGADSGRVDTIEDGDVLNVAGTSLLVKAAPGHAGTHLVFLDQNTGVLFTGDAAGARLKGTDYVCPTLAPPELDFRLWEQTVAMMQELGPDQIAVAHSGAFRDVDRHLQAVVTGIDEKLALAREVMRSPDDQDVLTEHLLDTERDKYAREGVNVEEAMRAMHFAMPAYMAAMGLARVLTKEGAFG